MKTVIIKDYIQGLTSFLDENNIQWYHFGTNDAIKIHFKTEEELFRMGFEFGKFYNKV